MEKFGRADQERLMAPSDPDIINLARGSVSFSMVRHPFERIVSAYKDKVTSNAHAATYLIASALWRAVTVKEDFFIKTLYMEIS